jgi:hypothetical protein
MALARGRLGTFANRLVRFAPIHPLVSSTKRAQVSLNLGDQAEGGSHLSLASLPAHRTTQTHLSEQSIKAARPIGVHSTTKIMGVLISYGVKSDKTPPKAFRVLAPSKLGFLRLCNLLLHVHQKVAQPERLMGWDPIDRGCQSSNLWCQSELPIVSLCNLSCPHGSGASRDNRGSDRLRDNA